MGHLCTFVSNTIGSFVTAKIDQSDRGVFKGLETLFLFEVVCVDHTVQVRHWELVGFIEWPRT